MSMAKNKWGKVVRGLARRRWWVQTGFLLAWLDPLMLRLHTVCSPVFHCYSCPLATFACPIGLLANFSAIHMIPFAVLGTLVVLGTVFGSFVCGWACPFGFLQHFFICDHSLGSALCYLIQLFTAGNNVIHVSKRTKLILFDIFHIDRLNIFRNSPIQILKLSCFWHFI